MTADTKPIEGGYMVYVPTLRERFFRWLGFRYHLGNEPQDVDHLTGWSKTDVYLHFGVLDRLRLLLTGRLFVGITAHFDEPTPKDIVSRIDWRIAAPGDDLRR